MGIQDREWYWKDREEKARAEREATAAAPRKTSIPHALITRANSTHPPKLLGADWHWSIQLLVWLCIAVLLLLAWRLVR